MASRQQILQRSTLLGKHGRDSSGLAADSASKRFKRGGMVRTGLPGAAGRSVTIADKHLAVGSRVGVYWRLDKMFYRVSRSRCPVLTQVQYVKQPVIAAADSFASEMCGCQ